MHTTEWPAIMQFRVSSKMKTKVATSSVLPQKFAHLAVAGTIADYTEGPFGCFFSQELRYHDWVIGWLDFIIEKPVTLYPVTEQAMVALYCGIDGNIQCRLQGQPGTLVLEERKFGLYYVPPGLLNKADFKPKHHTSVYISLSSAFFQQFYEQHPQFKKLYEKMQQEVAQGEQASIFPLGPRELGMINDMKHCKMKGDALRLYQHSQITLMLLHYFTQLSLGKQRRKRQHPEAVQQATAYIAQHYTKNIPIPKLARQANVNVTTLEKLFKAETGQTPVEYIQQYRLLQAEILIRTTSQLIRDIAAATGFTDSPHLCRLFLKKYELTPLQYRKKIRSATTKD